MYLNSPHYLLFKCITFLCVYNIWGVKGALTPYFLSDSAYNVVVFSTCQ